MRKNQKYTQGQMYKAIEQCKQECQSHMQYCNSVGIPYQTFKYWVNKYNREKDAEKPKSSTFLPLQVSQPVTFGQSGDSPEFITISYPNGIQVSCPVSVSPIVLKTLLNP
jgi:hypothetical protein